VDQDPGIYTVVLTGGIASGKTAVSGMFERFGAAVIDTDLIAREVVEPGQAGLTRIIEAFGKEFLDPEGRLNRRKMRDFIFSDPEKRSHLEEILHPMIAREVMRQVARVTAPYCVLVIPLFAESSSYSWADRVLVVDVSENIQIERVMARDGIIREQAQSILDSQVGRTARLALADDVLDNSGSLDELCEKVEKLHEKYLKLAL
jgi:dephospho-CoA kinase